jgi:hypothetical protein
VGDPQGDQIRIMTGIAAGDIVATTNQLDLYDGAQVSGK